jgi:hypothetical protein
LRDVQREGRSRVEYRQVRSRADPGQAKGALINPRTGGMCCLGVLCDVSGMPREVMIEYAGCVGGTQLALLDEIPNLLKTELVDMNDDRKPFSQIADFIERNL